MNKLLLAASLSTALLSAPAFAANQSVMIEFGVGFGPSGRVTKTKEQLANPFNNIFCYHRPSSRMVYGAVRYRYDEVEAHVGGWFNDSDQARCERDSYVVGLGYVFDTQNYKNNGTDDLYATYTPGIAYTWGKNKNFNVQDNTNTNWRLKDNWQMFNRLAVGTGNDNYGTEIAVIRYGNPIGEYERTGETFVTIGVSARDYDEHNAAAPVVTNIDTQSVGDDLTLSGTNRSPTEHDLPVPAAPASASADEE